MAKKPSRNWSTSSTRIRSSNPRSNTLPGPDPDPNPNLVHRTPSSAGAVFIPAKTLEFISLHDWWLCRATGKGLCVAGVEGSRARMFLSGRISKRHDTTTLETVDGIMIAINGMINLDRTQQNGFSLEVGNLFLSGFPYDWEDYGEEPANSSAWTEKPHSAEFVNDSDKAHYPVTLDDIPVCRIRDFLTLPLEDPEDCPGRKILNDILRSFKRFDSESNQDPDRSKNKDENSFNPENSGDRETRMIHLQDPQDCFKRKTWVDKSGKFDKEPKPYPGKLVRKDRKLVNVMNYGEQETPISPPRDSKDSTKLKTLVDVHTRSSGSDLSSDRPALGLLGTEDGYEANFKSSDEQETLIKNPLKESQGHYKRKSTATPIPFTGVRTRRMAFLTDLMNQQEDASLSKAFSGIKHDNTCQSRGTSRKKTQKKNVSAPSVCDDGNNVQGVVTRSASRRIMKQ